VSGDLVCRSADLVSRNGHPIARALDRDSAGRVLPQWSGCIRLSADQLFLINTPSHSFDSRYFGPVARNRIIERIVPLWTF
jgi:type IV secretory pathway protease TraF